MTGILAIETATEACSVALYRDGRYLHRFEVTPRQHSQRLFAMLRELLPGGRLCDHGIDAIAYGCGPGSFTGLRIAASAVQGLAFTNALPAVAVSTLACQVQTALRRQVVEPHGLVLSMLDARINEVYYALYKVEENLAVLVEGPRACSPAMVTLPAGDPPVSAIGSGCNFLHELPGGVHQRIRQATATLLPDARDLVPLALDKLHRSDIQQPEQVQPVYVRDEISWRKLSEQGRQV